MLNDFFFRLRSLFRRRSVESELEDELRFHFEHQLEKYIEAGMNPDEALRRARLEFGGLEQVKEDCRDARGVALAEALVQDLRYGWRTLLKSPGFAAAALFTLALGMGANTAIFSLVYGVLLRPLPFRDASNLILLNESTPLVGPVRVSYPNYQDWRRQSRTFSELSAVGNVQFNLSGIGRPENIGGLAVSPNFLSMMGVNPVLGRGFNADEEKAGTAPVVLLSYSLWQSHFGADPNAVGRTIRLDSHTATIVGVLPEGFRWMERCDVIEPIGVWVTQNDSTSKRGERSDLLVVGRLAAGVRMEQARAEMETIAAGLALAYPQTNYECGVILQPLREAFSGDVRPAMLVLLVAAIFVLMVACANVANLFLMRSAGRAREFALRLAIGASRGRIIRQMLTESFLIALLGGLGGLLLAFAGVPAIARLFPPDALAGANVDLNGAVLLFSGAVVVVSMFVFGLAPALESTSGNLHSDLRAGGKTTDARARNLWRRSLATSEVAIALVLLVGTGLMMKSLYRLLSVDSGFRSQHVVKMEMDLRTDQYDKDRAVLGFWQQTLDRVRVLPGVQYAAVGTAIPLTEDHSRADITVQGMPLPMPGNYPHPDIHIVSSDYEKALGIKLLQGRGFTRADDESAPRVAMINATAAKRLFPGADPIGKRFVFGHLREDRAPQWVTVVGVVADTRMYGLANATRLEVYVSFRQSVSKRMVLVVKSSQEATALVSAIREAIASIDREQPIFQIATMENVVNASISTRRITLILLGLFSGLALTLAAIGIYGVISYSVAQRTQEIGIRMALGAQPGDVLRLVLAQGWKISAAGILIGSAVSFVLTRLMANLLYSVSAVDPATFTAVLSAVALIATVASYLPARRTLRVDPQIALRQE